MTEPPVHTGVDEVQVHAHKTGHRWVDMTIALSAITISVISLFVAIDHGRIEEKMVAAASWPFLVLQVSEDGVETDLHTLTFRLKNSGVGPARVQTFRMIFNGTPVRDHSELLERCCKVERLSTDRQIALGLVSQNDPIGVIPAREGVEVLTWREMRGDASILHELQSARRKLSFEACYCSVLTDCWTSDLRSNTTPKHVAQCTSTSSGYES